MNLIYKNVYYDQNSRHQFNQLNESLFIEKLLNNLSTIMKDTFFDYDFFIFSHHGSSHIPSSIETKTDKKKVLLFFSDEMGTDPKPYAHHYYAIFKSYIGTKSKCPNVYALPLGYVKDVPHLPIIPINDRPINIFFRGNLNSNRLKFYRSLSRWKYLIPSRYIQYRNLFRSFLLRFQNDFSKNYPDSIIIFNNGFKQGYSPQEYGKVLAESKIVLCPIGFTTSECFRHFEAMRAGCIIISEKLPKTEFYLNSPIIEINDWEEGLLKAKHLLSDPITLEALHRETIAWWEKKCSEIATAKYIHSKLLQLEDSGNTPQ